MTLSEVVETEIAHSPFIAEALYAGIVNISSLARYMQDDISTRMAKDISEGAIVMAITRLPDTTSRRMDKSLSTFMRQLGDITVRSDLSDFSFKNSDDLVHRQTELLLYLQDHKSLFFSFCKGVNETTIVCSAVLSDQIRKIFAEEKMITHRSDLAAVSVRLPPKNLDTYGVYYVILKSLAWKGINVVEVLSTSHEITLIIGRDDVNQVFSIMLQLKNTRAR